MGLFDLPAPLLSFADAYLALLFNPFLRLVFWGVISALISMLFYRLLSRQQALTQLKSEIKSVQQDMNAFEGEFSDLMPLVRRNLGLAMKRVWMTLLPAIVAGLPLISVIAWCSNEFSYELPAENSEVPIHIVSISDREITIRFAPDIDTPEPSDPDSRIISWPSESAPVDLYVNDQIILQLPVSAPVSIIHKKQWWNSLVANPAGYLDQGSLVDAVKFQLPPQETLSFGADWIRSWWFTYFLVLIIVSIVLKFRFDIH